MSRSPRTPRSSTAVLAVILGLAASGANRLDAQRTPIGFEEEFALARDRSAALTGLIPGTEEHFFYTALLMQHERRFAEVPALLSTWIQRFGRTARVVEIENRQALLTYDAAPDATFAFLRQRLGLDFGHRRAAPGAAPDLPTRLDQSLISDAVLTRRALQRHPGTVDGFEQSALAGLATTVLDADVLASLLGRLRLPDVPNLPALVVRGLEDPKSGGFGTLPIHAELTLEQLDECVRLRPALLEEPKLVAAWLLRLQPSDDVDWRDDTATRGAYLERLGSFVARLSPAFNSLTAHVLHHRLAHDLAAGHPDEGRFRAYLRLPRPGAYVDPEYVRRVTRSEPMVDIGSVQPTGLPAIQDDEALVRTYLEHFLATAGSYDAYAETLRADWLRRVFAETKILAGVGDMQRWNAMLGDPEYYEQLRDRVEIRFAPTRQHAFRTGEPVSLAVDVKNVEDLLIKVFEIHTFNYLRATGHDVDASIDLDGLVPSEERTEHLDAGPLRRVRHEFSFPSLDHAGVFVVEFVGNGISSRALIRKGQLAPVVTLGAAGQVIRVLDEDGQHVRDASIWFAGREYAADDAGEIVIPYSTEPDRKTLILRRGAFSTLARFDHRREVYALKAGIHVDRESLLPGTRAQVLVRPSLQLDGHAIGAEFLEDPVLVIRAIDQDGVASSQDVRPFALFDDRESVHEITVPDRLRRLEVELRGTVRNLSLAEDVELTSGATAFTVDAIDATAQTGCPLLGRTPDGFVLDLLGKDGEPRADRAVQLRLVHRDYTDPIDVSLRTDARGRAQLGALDRIVSLRANGFPESIGAWELRPDDRTWPVVLQGAAGQVLRAPYLGDARVLSRDVVSLYELRGGVPLRDAFSSAALQDGFVELRGLLPGDYRLHLKEANVTIAVKVTAGEAQNGWAVGEHRGLEVADGGLLHIRSVTAADDALQIVLAHAGASARVHVVATRYLAPFDPFDRLAVVRSELPATVGLPDARSTYHEGRAIGDEYRYVLERRFATKFPGNMLARPSLLLNPWALDPTVTDEESSSFDSDQWNEAVGLGGGAGSRYGGRGGRRFGTSPGVFPNLAFLPAPSRVLANLRPDGHGVVRVALADLGNGHLVHVIAVDDTSTVRVTATLPEKPLAPAARRLQRGLDPARHLAEQRRIEFVPRGDAAVVDDARHAELAVHDSLASVYRLFRSLTGDEELARFEFVLRWPELSPEEKRSAYSEHACHELHFFLHQKDREFFDAVVAPYLANKLHQTFLDHWLLDDALGPFLEPWPYAQLNVVERILLSRRVDTQSASIARQVREQVDLIPPDRGAVERLFRRALRSDALAHATAVDEQLGKLERDRVPPPVTQALDPGERRKNVADALEVPEPEADAPGKGAPDESKRAGEPDLMFEALEQVQQLARGRRAEVRALFRDPRPTRRYVEHGYWHRRIDEQDADLVAANPFWADFAAADPRAPFVSTHVPQATSCFAEMMLALAVLDLPFQPVEHETETADGHLTIRAGSPLLLLRQEIAAVEPAPAGTPGVLVSQSVFRLDEPYRFEGNERRDAYLTDELLIDVAYGCRVVVTNPTSSARELELLMQIPEGAIPVNDGFETTGMPVRLEPYATHSVEFAFYLPFAGEAPQYPVHVSEQGRLVAAASPVVWTVRTAPSRVDTTSWEHVSQDAEAAAALRFLDEANLLRVDLSRLAWRMHDRAFFDAAIALLGARHVYSDVLWSYGVFHRDADTTRAYLRHADAFVAQCGHALVSPLVVIDPVERGAYQHVEFEPLFNPRAHRFGGVRRILDGDLAHQYRSLLTTLCYRPELDSRSWLDVTYYLLLQDRVEEALASFARVEPADVETRLQYDYARAYLDFFSPDHAIARGIAESYRDHPVTRWRDRFREVLAQLDEVDGRTTGAADTDERTRRLTELAGREPTLELTVEAGKVGLRYHNLRQCRVSYRVMDVEFLFSTHPFVQQGAGAFAWVMPNRADDVTLPDDRDELVFALPAELRDTNVLVEVSAGGLTRRQPHYATSMAVRWIESYGQLQVSRAADGAPLGRVYVKVFASTADGGVRFHKDGYTDLRGRFDYVSLSGAGAGDVARFAVLVLSEENGATIREVGPPAR